MKRFFAYLIALTMLFSLISAAVPAQAVAAGSTAGYVNTPSSGLNVRASASGFSTILSSLPKGSYVTLIAKSGTWWKVEYAKGSFGYVSESYIIKASGSYAASVKMSYGSLNIRTGAGASFPIQDLLPNGTAVVVISSSNGWSRILYNGVKTGYASSQYLAALSGGSPAPSSEMRWPVPSSSRINQYFTSTHFGIDIGVKTPGVAGDSIVATAGGKVVYSGWLSGYGYVIYINSTVNGKNIQTRYGHLKSAPLVNVGESVTAGQLIGLMGSTGSSTGVHLHFEVRIRDSALDCIANIDSTPMDPFNYVKY